MHKSAQCAREVVCDVAQCHHQPDVDGVQGALTWESEQLCLDLFLSLLEDVFS